MTTTRWIVPFAAAWLLPLGAVHAQANFPNRPIKIISVTGPGSASDTLVRRLGESVSKTLGQPVIVENRAGANGVVAARAAAKAPNDGYTLLVGGVSTHTAAPFLVKDLGYDPVKDFTAVSQLTLNPLILVTNSSLPVQTTTEFLKYAKGRQGKLNYGTGNSGGLVATHWLMSLAGFEAVGANYAGTAQAALDLAAGRLDFMVTDPGVVKSFITTGKVRALGITSKERLESMKELAPIQSQLPEYDYASWIGLWGPAGMPVDAAKKLNQAFGKALAEPDMVKFLGDIGMIPTGTMTPDQFQHFVQEQIAMWGRLTKQAGLMQQ